MATGLRLPLRWLTEPVADDPAGAPLVLDLDAARPAPPAERPAGHEAARRPRCDPRSREVRPGLGRWSVTVRQADEPALLVDGEGRVVALSRAACAQLQLSSRSIGMRLTEVLEVVDHTAAALAVPDAVGQLPPLRVLAGDSPLARSLVRLRSPGSGVTTWDVVGVAVAGGALAFFSVV